MPYVMFARTNQPTNQLTKFLHNWNNMCNKTDGSDFISTPVLPRPYDTE
jgi:hypothetical protein